MSGERLMREGRLKGYRQEAADLRIRLDGIRTSLRYILDPDEQLRHIKGELVSQQGMEFWAAQQKYLEILDEVERIERELGLKSGR